MSVRKAIASIPRTGFFRRAEGLSPIEIIAWWELRRFPYNIIVGTTGVMASVVTIAIAVICESKIGVAIGMPDPPIFGILAAAAYGIAANVCFTGGWIVELLLGRVLGMRSPRYAQIAFVLGVVGSVLLTLLPAIVTVVVATATLAGWIPLPADAEGYAK